MDVKDTLLHGYINEDIYIESMGICSGSIISFQVEEVIVRT